MRLHEVGSGAVVVPEDRTSEIKIDPRVDQILTQASQMHDAAAEELRDWIRTKFKISPQRARELISQALPVGPDYTEFEGYHLSREMMKYNRYRIAAEHDIFCNHDG